MSSELRSGQIPGLEESVRRGILFVVSSPSGGGKGTLIQRTLKSVPNLSFSISYTTRTPRNGELEGREYFFVNEAEFQRMVEGNEFLEWAHVHCNLYGTARNQVSRELNEGRDIILEVDVQGAASIKRLMDEAIGVFILPPSLAVLRERLTARGTDSESSLELRLRNAPRELEAFESFDYIIVNDDVERAAGQLASIVYAERARRERQTACIKRIFESFH